MLQRWTNDAFTSTVHRVVNTAGRERYSAPFFYEPNFDTEVGRYEEVWFAFRVTPPPVYARK